MSDSIEVPRTRKRIASPKPLLLTPAEAETLRAAVQRIIRASESSGLTGSQLEKPKPSRR